VYNPANKRTNLTRLDSSTVAFKYDNAGEVTVADSSVPAEDRGYFYDAGWNLNRRTNNGVTSSFIVDNKNQLTNAASVAFTFDANGNPITRDGSHYVLAYDDENRLTHWVYYHAGSSSPSDGDLQTVFVYDGLSRLRQRYEYVMVCNNGERPAGAEGDALPDGGVGGGCDWSLQSITQYVYDGNRVIQERDANNTPTVVYPRGIDLSGTMEGAGGIGGLLARSSTYSSGTGNWTNYAYYFADANGNVTAMIDASQSLVASYRYDPFGNLISSSGALNAANVYRFSSKEYHAVSGLYYYLYRFYDPGLQRWISRDPIGQRGGLNVYGFLSADPINYMDALGLVNVGQIVSGGIQVGGGLLAALGIALSEAPTVGMATFAVPTVFFGITHGMMEIGAGFKDDPTDERLEGFLDRFPRNAGEMVGLPFGRSCQKALGVASDFTNFGRASFGLLNEIANSADLALPLAEVMASGLEGGLGLANAVGSVVNGGVETLPGGPLPSLPHPASPPELPLFPELNQHSIVNAPPRLPSH
jgi:RHS repeat-associated protein